MYVTGSTRSDDFPLQQPAQSSRTGDCEGETTTAPCADAFVTKLSATTHQIVYSTYWGGSSDDEAAAIAVDISGSAYITGLATSDDFPTTANAYQRTADDLQVPFVVKFGPSGQVVYSTLVGGGLEDSGYGIAVDPQGAAYITGQTDSDSFPVTHHAFQDKIGGGTDAFVVKLDPSGSTLEYGTYIGGSDDDIGNGIAVDAAGEAYVVGQTASDDFPTVDPIQSTLSGSPDEAGNIPNDAFVTKLTADGQDAVYSTYLGGSDDDVANAAVLAGAGTVAVTGGTSSNDFPVASSQPPRIASVADAAFVVRIQEPLPATPTATATATSAPTTTPVKKHKKHKKCKKGYQLVHGKCKKKHHKK